ncbi:hypothetical protein AB0D42_29765 [Streptomyces sp. NPDC048304]|uniref:hypothetical protein n=1 Tax=Streptomyces sp. NPDC048304 TaxID=3154820 RepID=UPI0033CAA4D5
MEQWAGTLVKVLFVAFIVGVFSLVFMVSARGRKKKAQIREDYGRLARMAPERGWTYEARTHGRIDRYCGAGPMPGRGSNLSAWHYTTGEFRGRSFTYFEYRFVNPMSGADTVERNQPIVETVFVVTAPGSAPSVEILLPGKLDAVLDRREKTQLGVPEFDQNFRLIAADEDFVRNNLSGALVPFLLEDPRAKKSPLQLRDDELFTWYRGTLSPQKVEEKLNYLCDVLDRIPAGAWTAC